MRYLLDSDTCIGWMRNSRPQLVDRIEQVSPSNIVLCSVVVAELLFGVERSDLKHRARTTAALQQLRDRFVSVSFDDAGAEAYTRVRAALTSRGLVIGGNDMLIAATALAHDLTLVTHNTAEFSRIPDLKLEDWQ